MLAVNISNKRMITEDVHALVDELRADSEGLGHVTQGERAVRLQELVVGQNPHFTHVVTVVRGEEPVPLHFLLHVSCSSANSINFFLNLTNVSTDSSSLGTDVIL